MNELEKKINELYAIKDIINQLVADKQSYMTYNTDTKTWEAPACDPTDANNNWEYDRFTILNDLIIDLYVKAGIKPNKK